MAAKRTIKQQLLILGLLILVGVIVFLVYIEVFFDGHPLGMTDLELTTTAVVRHNATMETYFQETQTALTMTPSASP